MIEQLTSLIATVAAPPVAKMYGIATGNPPVVHMGGANFVPVLNDKAGTMAWWIVGDMASAPADAFSVRYTTTLRLEMCVPLDCGIHDVLGGMAARIRVDKQVRVALGAMAVEYGTIRQITGVEYPGVPLQRTVIALEIGVTVLWGKRCLPQCGDGVGPITPPATDGCNTVRVCGAPGEGEVPTWNGSAWVPAPIPEGGASTFIELTDTPDTYEGAAGQMAVVNGTEDGLIFFPMPSIPAVHPGVQLLMDNTASTAAGATSGLMCINTPFNPFTTTEIYCSYQEHQTFGALAPLFNTVLTGGLLYVSNDYAECGVYSITSAVDNGTTGYTFTVVWLTGLVFDANVVHYLLFVPTSTGGGTGILAPGDTVWDDTLGLLFTKDGTTYQLQLNEVP